MARNRYSLVEKLGEGGMGAVYTARDRLTQQTVALKQVILPPDQLRFNASNTTSDPYLSLALEFRTLAGLRHPHIISVLDYGFDDNGQPFFTMELLTNGKPITAVAKGQSLETQIRLINEMLLALSYLHRRGVLHAGAVDQHVHGACGGHHGGDGGRVAQVGAVVPDVRCAGFEHGGTGRFDGVGVAQSVDDDACARCAQRAGDGQADAGSGAGDEGGTVGEEAIHGQSGSRGRPPRTPRRGYLSSDAVGARRTKVQAESPRRMTAGATDPRGWTRMERD